MPEASNVRQENAVTNSVEDRLASDIERLEAVVAGWDEGQRDTALALKHAVEAFHQAGLRRLLAELKEVPTAAAALREAVSHPLIYAMLRRLELLRPSMLEQVEQALDAVRPALREHGGDVELVAITPPDRVSIRLLGSCDGCGSSQTTLTEGVEKSLRDHCDWLIHVDTVAGAAPPSGEQPVHFVSPFAEKAP